MTTRVRIKPRGGEFLLVLLLSFITATLAQSSLGGSFFPEIFGAFTKERTYDPSNPVDTCFDVIDTSDANGDSVMQNDEYTTFVAVLSEGDFNVTNYVDLPFTLKVNFIYLSLLPDGEGDPDGGIDVSGADPNGGGIALGEEEEYIQMVCAETQGAIEHARQQLGITRRPTGVPTESPTPSPSASPTESPTKSPSSEPTSDPSMGPTGSPTKSPISKPTASPTADPTESPTDPPSKSPSEKPTEAPSTVAPTGGPTASPITAEPTPTPTDDPTPRPSTATPSKSPVSEPITSEPTPTPTDEPTPKPSTATPSKSPVIEPITPAPTTKEPSAPPTKAPVTKEPTGAPTKPPTTVDPTGVPSSQAPIVGAKTPTEIPVGKPTGAPITSTESPTFSPFSEAPVVGSTAQTLSPSQAPIDGTVAPIGVPSTAAPITDMTSPTSGKPTPAITDAPTPERSSNLTVSPDGSGALPTNAATSPQGSPSPTPNPSPTSGATFIVDPDSDPEPVDPGPPIAIALVAAFIVSAAGYVFYKRRKRGSEDPEIQNLANKDLRDLEAGGLELERRANDRIDAEQAEGGFPTSGGCGRSSNDGSDVDTEGAIRPTIDTEGAVRPTISSRGDETTSDRDSGDSEGAVYSGEPYDNPDYIPGSTGPVSLSSASSQDVVAGVAGVPGVAASPRRHDGTDSSSAASDGGWSSSQGMSSLNTASFDAGTEASLLPGSPNKLLAVIGVADTVAHTVGVREDEKPSFIPVDDQNDSEGSNESMGDRRLTSPLSKYSNPSRPYGKVSRDDLNAAIEKGDWAMVGATAALLADSTHSDQSLSSTTNERSIFSTSSHSGASDSASSAAHRARELDRMVVRGDWEGVVLAAAQLEGTELRQRDEDTMGSASYSATEESSRNKEEMRAEVERLVRRVVPDEVDNIDEMMLQFEGREEELIETLRTMQERTVAQRARAAVQKTAKLEARARAFMSGSASASSSVPSADYRQRRMRTGSFASSEPSHYGDSNAGSSSVSSYREGSSVSDLEMSSQTDQDSSRKTTHSSLEMAIERGDWRAVGEAAAMMGGPSALIPDGDDSISSGLSESAGRSERVYYLDALIAKGDWAGIVAAAGKYQAMDDRSSEPGSEQLANAEEREALAQATMWENIANQSKIAAGGGEETQGALDAADWAIQRSLERKMSEAAGTNPNIGESDVAMHKIMDDESV